MTTIFEEEIRSQAHLLAERSESGQRSADAAAALVGASEYLLVAARGSSDNAAKFFQYFVGRQTGRLVALATPSLFEQEPGLSLGGAGVIAISQSGRSPGIATVVNRAVAQGRPTIGVTNDAASPLGQSADGVLDLAAGPERAIASTKTFSTTWQALAQLVQGLKGTTIAGLAELPDVVGDTVAWALATDLAIDAINAPQSLTVVGRGIGAAAADEIALKIREVSGLRAEAYAVADYLHGPIGADGDGCTLLLVVTNELDDAVADEVLDGARQAGMTCVVLRSPDRDAVNGDHTLVLPGSWPDFLTGLAAAVVGQVLALRLGERRGRPIDTSPRLKKITLSA